MHRIFGFVFLLSWVWLLSPDLKSERSPGFSSEQPFIQKAATRAASIRVKRKKKKPSQGQRLKQPTFYQPASAAETQAVLRQVKAIKAKLEKQARAFKRCKNKRDKRKKALLVKRLRHMSRYVAMLEQHARRFLTSLPDPVPPTDIAASLSKVEAPQNKVDQVLLDVQGVVQDITRRDGNTEEEVELFEVQSLRLSAALVQAGLSEPASIETFLQIVHATESLCAENMTHAQRMQVAESLVKAGIVTEQDIRGFAEAVQAAAALAPESSVAARLRLIDHLASSEIKTEAAAAEMIGAVTQRIGSDMGSANQIPVIVAGLVQAGLTAEGQIETFLKAVNESPLLPDGISAQARTLITAAFAAAEITTIEEIERFLQALNQSGFLPADISKESQAMIIAGFAQAEIIWPDQIQAVKELAEGKKLEALDLTLMLSALREAEMRSVEQIHVVKELIIGIEQGERLDSIRTLGKAGIKSAERIKAAAVLLAQHSPQERLVILKALGKSKIVTVSKLNALVRLLEVVDHTQCVALIEVLDRQGITLTSSLEEIAALDLADRTVRVHALLST